MAMTFRRSANLAGLARDMPASNGTSQLPTCLMLVPGPRIAQPLSCISGLHALAMLGRTVAAPIRGRLDRIVLAAVSNANGSAFSSIGSIQIARASLAHPILASDLRGTRVKLSEAAAA